MPSSARNELVRRHVPLLAEAVPLIAHAAIRNRGTIGGSLAFADPAAELPACCVALDAIIVARNAAGRAAHPGGASSSPASTPRRCAPDELIAAVEFPGRQAGRAQHHPRAGAPLRRLRHGRRRGAGRSSPAARSVEPRLVFFGVGDGPVLAERAMAAHRRQAGDRRRRSPRRRPRSTPISTRLPTSTAAREMKRHLARVLLARALQSPRRPRGGARRMSTARRHRADGQRRARRAPRRGAPASDRFPAPRPRPDGLAHGLRARRVRRLHGARRRQDRARLPGAGGLARRRQGRDHRGRLRLRRDPRPAGRLRRPQRLPVRLLHARHAADRRRSPGIQARRRRARRSASTSPATTAAAPAITPSSMRSRRWQASATERPGRERDHRSPLRRPAELLHRQVDAAPQCQEAGGGPRPVSSTTCAAAHGARGASCSSPHRRTAAGSAERSTRCRRRSQSCRACCACSPARTCRRTASRGWRCSRT